MNDENGQRVLRVLVEKCLLERSKLLPVGSGVERLEHCIFYIRPKTVMRTSAFRRRIFSSPNTARNQCLGQNPVQLVVMATTPDSY